jgi:hypothetical protein
MLRYSLPLRDRRGSIVSLAPAAYLLFTDTTLWSTRIASPAFK